MINKVYIMCPTKTATGGTELLHQLSEKLIKYNIDTYMFYKGDYNNSSVKKTFESYMVKRCNSIEDSEDNLLIVPETMIKELFEFKNIMKAVWWLSVDFYPRII